MPHILPELDKPVHPLASRGTLLGFYEVLGVKPQELWAEGKHRRIVEARSLLCYWAARGLGLPMSTLARKLGYRSRLSAIPLPVVGG